MSLLFRFGYSGNTHSGYCSDPDELHVESTVEFKNNWIDLDLKDIDISKSRLYYGLCDEYKPTIKEIKNLMYFNIDKLDFSNDNYANETEDLSDKELYQYMSYNENDDSFLENIIFIPEDPINMNITNKHIKIILKEKYLEIIKFLKQKSKIYLLLQKHLCTDLTSLLNKYIDHNIYNTNIYESNLLKLFNFRQNCNDGMGDCGLFTRYNCLEIKLKK